LEKKLHKKIYIGTMGWSYKFWKDNFYSSNTKPEKFLEQYSKHSNTVEVNSTFYHVPSMSTIKNWEKQTDPNFLFSIKAPKKVTHDKLSKDTTNYLDFFLKTVSNLGTKLGPILFQFPSSFKSDNHDLLRNFLSVLSKKFRYAIEVRNKSWCNAKFYKLLEDHKLALVLGDNPLVCDLKTVTTDFIYFRWEGNRKQINGTLGKVEKERCPDIQKWGNIIQTYSGETEVFGYFSKYYSGFPPTDVKYLLDYLSPNEK
jgi:uncharacterized protein YecE (DUF72 family)